MERHASAEESMQSRFYGALYNKGEMPSLGLGFSGHAGGDKTFIDMKTDGIFADFGAFRLDHAEADLTFVEGPISLSPFAFRSLYCGNIPLASGIAMHVSGLDLHIAPLWVYGKNSLPVAISWTPALFDKRVRLLLKILPITNEPWLARPAPALGGEIGISTQIAERVQMYWKAFEMTARDRKGDFFVSALNGQGGFQFDL